MKLERMVQNALEEGRDGFQWGDDSQWVLGWKMITLKNEAEQKL